MIRFHVILIFIIITTWGFLLYKYFIPPQLIYSKRPDFHDLIDILPEDQPDVIVPYRIIPDNIVREWFQGEHSNEDDTGINERGDIMELRNSLSLIKTMVYDSDPAIFMEMFDFDQDDQDPKISESIPERPTVTNRKSYHRLKRPYGYVISPNIPQIHQAFWQDAFHDVPLGKGETKVMVLPSGYYTMPDLNQESYDGILFTRFVSNSIFGSPMLARRQLLREGLLKFTVKYGCSFQNFERFPEVRDCSDSKQLEDTELFIMKPHVPKNCHDPTCIRPPQPVIARTMGNCLLERKLANPLLIHSKKSTLHALVLVIRQYEVWRGYLNRGFVVLEGGERWDTNRFVRYLNTFEICSDECDELWNQMEDVSRFMFHAFAEHFTPDQEASQFEVFELQFAINSQAQIFFQHGLPFEPSGDPRVIREAVELVFQADANTSFWSPIIYDHAYNPCVNMHVRDNVVNTLRDEELPLSPPEVSGSTRYKIVTVLKSPRKPVPRTQARVKPSLDSLY